MTKYTRLTGKVFGSSATATGDDPQIGQFGSALAGSYNGTTDVATIQSLPAWQKGFIGAVTPNTQFPPLPEMTGFGKVLSHQICYLLQQGVPEYDNDTTYYDGNWCSYQKKLYFCKNDNGGIGISEVLPTNVTYWSQFTGGSSRNIGEYVTSSLPLNDPTLHLADGSQLSGSTYPELASYIASIYSTAYNWQALTQPYDIGYAGSGTTNRAHGAAYGNDIQIFICKDGTTIYHKDGYQSWGASGVGGTSTNWRNVAHGNNCFVAIDSTGHIRKSPSDSYSDIQGMWTQLVDLAESSWKSICYGSGKYVALSDIGYISISSDDGANWSTPVSTITGAGSLAKILYDGTKFVILSATGYITTSTDGSNWTTPAQMTNLSTKTWVDFTYNNGKFTALSEDGYLSTSTDGSSWSVPSRENLPTATYNWTAIAPTEDGGLYAVTVDGYVSGQTVEPISPFVTEADWQATNTAYGECGKYVYNSGVNTIRIPNLCGYFKNTTTTSELGDLTPASIPNIKATFSGVGQAYFSTPMPATLTGSVYRVNTADNPADGVPIANSGAGVERDDVFGFDASRSSSVYSDSATTINPQSVKQLVYIVVAK